MGVTQEKPQFNIWLDPWLTAETLSGEQKTVSLEHLLLKASAYRALYDPSPLVVVGIHRLLVAILQDIFNPQDEVDLLDLWEMDAFPTEEILQFGEQYGRRFNLFSTNVPFLQSADIPLVPEKKGKVKSVGYLFPEQTAGTAVTHYNHTYEVEQNLCSGCCAKGVLIIPSFASSGGAGIRPSVNGVPPIYILPGGETYYHSLVASLTTPYYQPDVADREGDSPWWRHESVVGKSAEVLKVGYLHSLTFPARRMRLYPERMVTLCSRCGGKTDWGVREMVFEMGESRPKDAAFWRDPFAAYRVKEGKPPIPIRPVEGKAVWREFGSLFLSQRGGIRSSVVDQLEAIREDLPYGKAAYPFQTVGLRTDMKAKIFEWQMGGFLIPPNVLSDSDSAVKINSALDFASKSGFLLRKTYQDNFDGFSKEYPDATPIKGTNALKRQMVQAYWQRLGDVFHLWIMKFIPQADVSLLFDEWVKLVVDIGIDVFRESTRQLNTGTSTALICEAAINHCQRALFGARKKMYEKEEKI